MWRRFVLIIPLLLVCSAAYALDSCVVPDATTYYIDEHDECREVTNAAGQDIMVPTKTANEWATGGVSFFDNTPTGVSLAACGGGSITSCTEKVPCGGAEVGGYCWYLGDASQSCDAACAAQGLTCDLTATRDYVGSNGSDANCQAVSVALGTGSTQATVGTFGAWGCNYNSVFNETYRATSATTNCTAAPSGANRICACSE